jgi:hypothetical protein
VRGEPIREWVQGAEAWAQEEQLAALTLIAGRDVEIDADERNAAIRRAELLLAAGGDPHRRLELHDRAVGTVAADLDAPLRRAQLEAGLRALGPELAGLPALSAALQLLLADDGLAWQAFALSVLADALGEDGE